MKEKQAQPSICFGDDVMNQIRTDLFYYFVVVFFAITNQELSRGQAIGHDNGLSWNDSNLKICFLHEFL